MVGAIAPSVEPAVWATVPIAMAGVWLSFRHPLVGALLVLLASGICAALAVPYGALETLLPTLWVLYWLRRRHSSWALGLALVVGFTLVSALRDGAAWYALPTGLVVYGIPWLFGRLVWSRERAARRATAETARLAGADLHRMLQASSDASRQETARASLVTLQASVARMVEHLQQATARLERDRVDAVRAEGAAAIAELHRILRALRSARLTEPAALRRTTAAVDGRSPRLVLPALGALAGCGLLLVNPVTPALLAAASCFLVAGIVQRRLPLLGAAIGSTGLIAAALDPPPFPEPLAIWLAAAVWQLTSLESTTARIARPLVIAAALPLGVANGVEGVAFVALIVLLAMVAAWGWREHDMIVRTEQERLARLFSAIATAQLRLDERARQQLVGELHDGLSHGITAMTLHAQAALALADRDPTRSLRALALAQQVGERTLADLATLMHGDDERDARGWCIGTLVESLQQLDVPVECFAHGRRAMPTVTDALAYRIVQESLTNALRHAHGAAIEIRVDEDGGEQRIAVITRPDAHPAPTAPSEAERILTAVGLRTGTGLGLTGLAARVRRRGGSFTAGRAGAEFHVLASWPTRAPADAALAGALLEAGTV